MTGEQAIYVRLMGQSSITALIGDRVYPNAAPQKSDAEILPYVVYHAVDKTHEHHMKGSSGVCWSRVQLDIFAGTYARVKQVAEAIRLVLQGFSGVVTVGTTPVRIDSCFLNLELDEYDAPIDGGQKGRHRVIQDYRVGYYEAIPAFSGV